MKQNNYLVIIIISALLFVLTGTTHVWAGPRAVPVAPVFEFDPVVEGTHITHDFIIKNQGDVPLNIIAVRPP